MLEYWPFDPSLQSKYSQEPIYVRTLVSQPLITK